MKLQRNRMKQRKITAGLLLSILLMTSGCLEIASSDSLDSDGYGVLSPYEELDLLGEGNSRYQEEYTGTNIGKQE